jgi:hypothetical protein
LRIPLAAVAALSALTTGSVHGADTAIQTNPVPYFVTLEPIETPIISPSRIEGRMQISLVLEAKDAESARIMTDAMPRLRATALANTIEFGRLHASGFSAMDVAALNAAISGSLGQDYPGLKRVLIVKAAAIPTV